MDFFDTTEICVKYICIMFWARPGVILDLSINQGRLNK